MKIRTLALILAMGVPLSACSSDSSDDKAGTDSVADAGKSATVEVTAADGGEVKLGAASLAIPADSLDEDTTITVETASPSSDLPDSENLRGLVYDFGPDGTTFSKPATLTVPGVKSPGEDKVPVVAWLNGDTWEDLPTTSNEDGSLSAEVSHFSTFVVRLNGVVSTDCSSFSACGGDPVGTWTISSVCATVNSAIEDVCPTGVFGLDLDLQGTVTFDADGTYANDLSGKSKITYSLQAACLDTITQGHPPASCDELSKPAEGSDGPTTCTGDPSDECTCVVENEDSIDASTGTYAIMGNVMNLVDDADGDMKLLNFCIKGSEGRFQENADEAVLNWVATRK